MRHRALVRVLEGWEHAFDSKQLLEREDSQANDPQEVMHYIRIYGALIDFKQYLLSRATGIAGRPSPEARTGILTPDICALREQLGRYQRRLEFWCHRLMQLKRIDLDAATLSLRHAGKMIGVTQREYELLACLARHPGRVLTARQLVNVAWGQDHLSDKQLRTYVGRLRGKIKALKLPCSLVNIPRQGYVLMFD